jgi:dihydrofolate synthase/folylpolyglutamate synthase
LVANFEAVEAKRGDVSLTYFEFTTLAILRLFAQAGLDAVILEVGLGGRLDATNVVERPLVTAIASLALDHQHFLGSDIVSIAREKAGIAKAGVPLVSLAQLGEAETVIAEIAAERGAPLLLEGRDWAVDPDLRPGLAGPHQRRNAGLAWAMLSAQDRLRVGRATFLEAIATAQWPARFQKLRDGPLTLGKATWIDGAHNPGAAAALAEILAERGPMYIVLGILANKDADAIVGALAPHAVSLTFVPVPDHDHHDPATLAARFGGRSAESLHAALIDLPEPRLIAGSLYLAGEALAANDQPPD